MKRVACIAGLLGIVVAMVVGWARFDRWIDITALPPLATETSVEMRDRNGDLLRVYTVDEGRWRMATGVAQVDPLYPELLIAFEDKRYFSHSGVDPWAMVRATGQALWHGRVVSGASTLTMQVARLLEDSGTGSWGGKLRQIRLALALERKLSKHEILDLYLTLAPFGGNLEGVRAASLSWFGKEPRRLTPDEAALLVALPQSPETRRPDRDWRAARAGRDRVLARAHDAGVISGETLESAWAAPVPRQRQPFPALAPHMTDRVRTAFPLSMRHYLSLDRHLQEALERLATARLSDLSRQISVAIMVADHSSGEILASVGSASYGKTSSRQGFVDMTRAARSPGSTLKPLVYAMAFDLGLAHPETVIEDRPVAFGSYAPRNFDGRFRGEIRVSEALRLSLNIPVVLLMNEIGPARFMSGLKRAGIGPTVTGGKPGLAVALGGLGISLHELVQLFAGLARGGEAIELSWKPDESSVHERQRFVSRAAAWHVGHILSQLTPSEAKANGRLAFKTGTSYGHRDAWAVGYDGRHVAGVWIGRPDGTPVPGAFGGDLAAPLLLEVFQRLKPKLDPLPPPPPEALILGNSDLPAPLQRFRGRQAVFSAEADAPVLAFPPDGVRVSLEEGMPLVVKLRDGVPPFAVLADGAPQVTGHYQREIALEHVGKGFVTLSVIDARGRSARAVVEVD